MSKSKLFQVLKSNAKPTHVLLSYNTIIVQDILIVFGLMEKKGVTERECAASGRLNNYAN